MIRAVHSSPRAWRIGALMVLALGAVLFAAASRSDAGVTTAKRCWPGDRYHHNSDIPSQYADHAKYANCSDCDNVPTLAIPVGKCELWFGGQTADDGHGGISHKGWPGLTGVRWQVTSDSDRGETANGSPFNDELDGRHGSDTLNGGAGNDVIWGDSSNSKLNNSKQRDVLNGGPGNDWIYASHGTNIINGGPGNDTIVAYYGKGTIDCGPGDDTVTVRKHTRYKIKNCEHITHPGNP